MDTKETTLKKVLLSCDMEYLESEIIECLKEDTAEGKMLRACTEAMQIHARNCMIEVLRWYMNDSFDQKHADKYVDRFLQSDHFKELTK